jgi:nucleoside-diphosphate-sugar epimerase
MKVFVAGGTGQLGQATIPLLVAAGHQVRATARGDDRARLVASQGAEPVEVDLFDAEALGRVIAGTDAVLRLTTKIPPMTEMRNPRAWEPNNRLRTEGARALVNAVLEQGVRCYVSESVTFVYADGGDEWIGEESPVDAAGVAVLEAALESEAEARRVTAAGAASVVLRFGSFYSATSEQTRGIARLARRRMFPVIGRGANYYSSIAVGDAARAVVAALAPPPGTYNAVDDEPLRYRDYVAAYAAAVGGPKPLRVPRVIGVAGIGAEVARYLLRSARAANARLREATGWAPLYVDARAGLAAIAADLQGD